MYADHRGLVNVMVQLSFSEVFFKNVNWPSSEVTSESFHAEDTSGIVRGEKEKTWLTGVLGTLGLPELLMDCPTSYQQFRKPSQTWKCQSTDVTGRHSKQHTVWSELDPLLSQLRCFCRNVRLVFLYVHWRTSPGHLNDLQWSQKSLKTSRGTRLSAGLVAL